MEPARLPALTLRLKIPESQRGAKLLGEWGPELAAREPIELEVAWLGEPSEELAATLTDAGALSFEVARLGPEGERAEGSSLVRGRRALGEPGRRGLAVSLFVRDDEAARKERLLESLSAALGEGSAEEPTPPIDEEPRERAVVQVDLGAFIGRLDDMLVMNAAGAHEVVAVCRPASGGGEVRSNPVRFVIRWEEDLLDP